MKTTRQQSESRSQLKNESGSTYSSKRRRSLYFFLPSLCFVLSALLVLILIPRVAVAADNTADPPEVTVEVFDVKHLDKVINSIKGVPGVLDVERMQGAV